MYFCQVLVLNMITITHKPYGSHSGSEYTAAESIVSSFKQLSNNNSDIKGDILVLSKLQLPGGEEVKDVDILVTGRLEGFSLQFHCKGNDKNRKVLEETERVVRFISFCVPIELKDHVADDVRLSGLGEILVKYKDWHSATEQNEKQKYAIKNVFDRQLNASPWIRNLIWLRQLNVTELQNLIGDRALNVICGPFNIVDFFQTIVKCSESSHYPFQTKNGFAIINDFYGPAKDLTNNNMSSVFEMFVQQKNACGELTRKKLELLTSKIIEQQSIEGIGDKMVVFKGRAGTGKTIRLLQTAYKLADSEDARCLILTYNHALVSDIKRIIAFSGMPDGIDSRTVQIKTLHSFFFELFKTFELHKGGLVPDDAFEDKYAKLLEELVQISNRSTQQTEERLYYTDATSWDYILIDEAQDWTDNEKRALVNLFGKERIIVADGVDQFMRNNNHQNWVYGLKKGIDYVKRTDELGLRQKYNLVIFANAYAQVGGIKWFVEPNDQLRGGKVIITSNYNKELHNSLLEICHNAQCVNYDMLFLVPPTLVNRTGKDSQFKDIDLFERNGIHLFDGTNHKNRGKYPTDLSQCRLFQYDSCRGLEGWVTICMNFDELINYKEETFTAPNPIFENEMKDPNLIKEESIYLWSLMPLTRPVDRLVITLQNTRSKVALRLKKIADLYPDFVEWRIK